MVNKIEKIFTSNAEERYNSPDYNPETDDNAHGAMAYLKANREAHLKRVHDEITKDMVNESVRKVLADEYARLKKEDNEAVREDSGARPRDLEKKYNKDMVRDREDANVKAPDPLKEIIVENTRAILAGDQPMAYTPEIGRMVYQAVYNREPTALELQKMNINAKLSEKMYAEHGSSVSRITAEVNKAIKDLANPKTKGLDYVGMAQEAARGK